MTRERLDRRLVAEGLAPSRERARSLILAGKVTVDGVRADKAGLQVGADAVVTLAEPDHPYVSRGALKLVHGLDAFDVEVAGKTALDVGASTGGFTDVLLERGADRVIAVDVGYGQLAWRLRQDARVTVMERTNIRKLGPDALDTTPDLAVIDVSFISLAKVLPSVTTLIGTSKDIVALVKPQFEVGKSQVGKGGVVRDEQTRLGALEAVASWATDAGYRVRGTDTSPITGPAGNVEYLIHLVTP